MKTIEIPRVSATGGALHAPSAPAGRPARGWRPRLRSALTPRLDTRTWLRTRFATDLVILYAASLAAVLADPAVHLIPAEFWLAMAFPIVVTLLMRVRENPDGLLSGSMLDTAAFVLGVVSLATVGAIAVGSMFSAHPLRLALRLWLFSAVYLGLLRTVLLSARRYATRSGAHSVPTLIVGAGKIGAHLVMRLTANPSYGLRPVGFLDSDPLPQPDHAPPSVPILGGAGDLISAVRQTGARRVILAFSSNPDHHLVMAARQCQALGVQVSLVPRFYEAINERTVLDHVGGVPLLTLNPVDPRGWQFAVKHTLDRSAAAIGIVLASPLLLILALLVRLSSPGPVLFRQRRVGRDGHEFNLLKFRTMWEPTSSSVEFELDSGMAPGGVEGVDRRTWIGRLMRDTSMDELPQLFNVLRGDMSLVGPRPERPEFVERFSLDIDRYQDRHRVKSGITGWAQVHGLRGQTSIEDRVEWDNYYIQNWSLRLDLQILALTIVEVLRLRERRRPTS